MPVMSLCLVGLLTIFLFAGLPVAVSLGLSSLLVMMVFSPVPLEIIPQLFSESTTSFVMLAVPLFIFAGYLMEQGTMGRNLINFTTSIVGWMTGGLGNATIVGSMIFGGISGSSLADTAVFSSILVPRMEGSGYPKTYAAATVLSASCLAVIIPPSINIVLTAAITQQSVSKALAAGLVPGLLFTAMLLVPNYYISKKYGYGSKINFSVINVLSSLKNSWTALIAPLIILGSIFSGVVTPTEGAAVTALYVLMVDGVIFKKISFKGLKEAFINSSKLTSNILFIATSSAVANWILGYEGIHKMLLQVLHGMPGGKSGFMISFILIMLFLGTIMDGGPIIIIFAPLIFPLAMSFGIDPIHYITIFIVAVAMGLITPPYGVCLFSVSSITKVPMSELVKSSLPFYAALVIALILIAFVPQISLFLPALLGL